MDSNHCPLCVNPWVSFDHFNMKIQKIYFVNLLLFYQRETVRYLSVYLGAHDITLAYEANRRLYNGYEIYIHPEWNPTTMAGDIAMIKLATIVTYTRNNHLLLIYFVILVIIIQLKWILL